jgi:monoamine oxidase
VTAIDYSSLTYVLVTTADGSVFNVSKVILTVPLGVLQANSITFNPPLAKTKTAAINRLGMGVMDKLWL